MSLRLWLDLRQPLGPVLRKGESHPLRVPLILILIISWQTWKHD